MIRRTESDKPINQWAGDKLESFKDLVYPHRTPQMTPWLWLRSVAPAMVKR